MLDRDAIAGNERPLPSRCATNASPPFRSSGMEGSRRSPSFAVSRGGHKNGHSSEPPRLKLLAGVNLSQRSSY